MIDKQLKLSSGQALTDDAVSDYSVDLSAVRDVGKGKQLFAFITIDTAANAADAAKTLTISAITSASANLGTPTVLASTQAYTGAVLTAGREPIVIAIPPGGVQQYLGIQYDVSATFTSFTVSAYIGTEIQTNL